MPALSLVVCVHGQRDLLQRLIEKSSDLYDDLVVIHDGPDETQISTVVKSVGGRFFERPREHQQEPHWPFAWKEAKHDWILRLDADEFPSTDLATWLRSFRNSAEFAEKISGFTCIWPMWNGTRTISRNWPAGRIFLFNRNRVRFFGMPEQTPIPDAKFESINLALRHEPPGRQSHSLRNLLFRKQAYLWRRQIARGLLGNPMDLPCWRWESPDWPAHWEQVRTQPFRTAIRRLIMYTLRALHDQWKVEHRLFPFAAISGPVNHALFCAQYSFLKRLQSRTKRLTSD